MFLKSLVITLIGLLVAGLSPDARAWGPRGHEVVAEIAARGLDPKPRREVERLLGDRASNAMREASTWADDVRYQPSHKHTFPWHFVNFERGDCRLDRKRQCPKGDCVFGAIESQAKVLADRTRPDPERIEALRFVIHFVGDVHQPLHAGWRDDRGGNDTQIRFRGEGINLHALWDNQLIRREGVRVREHADHIAGVDHGWPVAWNASAATDWTLESCAIVDRDDFYPSGSALPKNYVQVFRPIAEQRLHAAGERLAALLNDVLGD